MWTIDKTSLQVFKGEDLLQNNTRQCSVTTDQ
jgi:hypothetical protein